MGIFYSTPDAKEFYQKIIDDDGKTIGWISGYVVYDKEQLKESIREEFHIRQKELQVILDLYLDFPLLIQTLITLEPPANRGFASKGVTTLNKLSRKKKAEMILVVFKTGTNEDYSDVYKQMGLSEVLKNDKITVLHHEI